MRASVASPAEDVLEFRTQAISTDGVAVDAVRAEHDLATRQRLCAKRCRCTECGDEEQGASELQDGDPGNLIGD